MNITVLKDEYENNAIFKEYVDRYMKQHRMVSIESVLKCALVQAYYRYLHDEN